MSVTPGEPPPFKLLEALADRDPLTVALTVDQDKTWP